MANKLTAGDVSANFDGFVPTGNVYVGQPLFVQCTFSNTANAPRTVNVRLSVTACDYRGIPVIAMKTRRQKYPMRLPLEGMETELRKSLTLGPGEEVRFEQMIDADSTEHTIDRFFLGDCMTAPAWPLIVLFVLLLLNQIFGSKLIACLTSIFPNLEIGNIDLNEDIDNYWDSLDEKDRNWAVEENEYATTKLGI